jgi:hypothetical protein
MSKKPKENTSASAAINIKTKQTTMLDQIKNGWLLSGLILKMLGYDR